MSRSVTASLLLGGMVLSFLLPLKANAAHWEWQAHTLKGVAQGVLGAKQLVIFNQINASSGEREKIDLSEPENAEEKKFKWWGAEKKQSAAAETEKTKNKSSKKKPDHIEEIREAVKFASSITGVRQDFLMGMLVVESDLGRNTGGCTYEEVERGAEKAYEQGRLSHRSWITFQERRNRFKGIVEGLDHDYKKLTVSCNPSRYAGTGGAMGVPQFMPDTWLEYKDRISEAVGKENPDPWDLRDGVVAMAIKLADVPGVKSHQSSAERRAAKLYLSGTTSWQYDWYANQIFYWAANYEKLIG